MNLRKEVHTVGRASKTIENTAGHRTKKEKQQREAAEKALLTGVSLCERSDTASNPIAHTEFSRINNLLKIVGKNDAMYEAIINRYCVLQAECIDFEHKREKFNDNLDQLTDDDELDSDSRYKYQAQMQKTIITVDKQIQAKRKMILDIEKECGFTLAAALRSIPKKVDTEDNPILKALRGDD